MRNMAKGCDKLGVVSSSSLRRYAASSASCVDDFSILVSPVSFFEGRGEGCREGGFEPAGEDDIPSSSGSLLFPFDLTISVFMGFCSLSVFPDFLSFLEPSDILTLILRPRLPNPTSLALGSCSPECCINESFASSLFLKPARISTLCLSAASSADGSGTEFASKLRRRGASGVSSIGSKEVLGREGDGG